MRSVGAGAVRLDVRRIGQHVTASVAGDGTDRWQLQVAGIKTITARNGARITPDPLGIILQPPVGSHELEFEL